MDAPRQRNTRKEYEQIKEGSFPEGFEASAPKGRQKDREARWTKKNIETHYGYKNHAKEDAKSKLIDKAVTTLANVHDCQVFKELVDESDQAVLADSAYYSAEHEEHLLECNAEEFLMRKGNRNNPLSAVEEQASKGGIRI